MKAFEDRLKRIQKRGAVIEIAPIGPSDEQGQSSAKRRKRRVKPEQLLARPKRHKVNPMVILIALVLGGVAVAAARFGRALYFDGSLTGDAAGTAMGLDFVAALAIGLVLKVILGAKSPQFVAGQTIGAGVMVLAMHNLVHAAPELWQLAFPQAWVNEVVATTQPHSILIKGISFEL
jgi:hypothetical protein